MVYIPLDWSLKPAGIGPSERFRLIFLSSTKRNAASSDIETYNTFVQNQAAAGHANIQDHASSFKVVGCTQAVDARDNTRTNTNGPGVPIYWVGGAKVADSYTDFYDGSWDDEANDKNELGNDAHDTSQSDNYPWTGCDHDGTKYVPAQSLALGKTAVQTGQPNSSIGTRGPLRGVGSALKDNTRPFYALSPVFQVPSMNASRLSPTGAPHPGKITSDTDNGIEHSVELHQGVTYQIDVKGSESSQYGGTIINPRVKIFAGRSKLELLNGSSSAGVSQTNSETRATGGGIGANSRLTVKAVETQDYDLLVHRASGDNGTYTITVTRLDWPQGRRAPEITVTAENRTGFRIAWLEPAKTQESLVAPIQGYKVQRRTLPDGGWSNASTKSLSQLSHEYTGLTQGQSYEVRVQSYHSNEGNNTHRWGYATVYADDCATSGANTCSIAVNQAKKGRINYHASEDIDGYTVRLVNGRTYVIKANGKSSHNGTLVDPYLTLTRISNNAVSSNNDGGKGLNSKITHRPTSTGDYRINVSSHVTGERGSYRVKVTEQ